MGGALVDAGRVRGGGDQLTGAGAGRGGGQGRSGHCRLRGGGGADDAGDDEFRCATGLGRAFPAGAAARPQVQACESGRGFGACGIDGAIGAGLRRAPWCGQGLTDEQRGTI